jgi:hypothetical protein
MGSTDPIYGYKRGFVKVKKVKSKRSKRRRSRKVPAYTYKVTVRASSRDRLISMICIVHGWPVWKVEMMSNDYLLKLLEQVCEKRHYEICSSKMWKEINNLRIRIRDEMADEELLG